MKQTQAAKNFPHSRRRFKKSSRLIKKKLRLKAKLTKRKKGDSQRYQQVALINMLTNKIINETRTI
jgi:hypothetical protein